MTRIRTRSVTGGIEPRTYKSLVEEIKEIDRAIFECRRELARDKVQTSDKSFPYTQHGKTIEGINLTRLRRLEIQRKRAEIINGPIGVRAINPNIVEFSIIIATAAH